MDNLEIFKTALNNSIKNKEVFYEDLLDEIFRFENIDYKYVISFSDTWIEVLEQYASDNYDLE